MDFEHLREELIQVFNISKGSLFGHKGLKVKGKIFAFYNEPNLVVKLDEQDRAQALQLEGAKNFNPMGTPMKEWIEIPLREEWYNYAVKAMKYVESLIKL